MGWQLGAAQLPSLVVLRCDALSGRAQHSCFLVLDLVSKTNMEMELEKTFLRDALSQ